MAPDEKSEELSHQKVLLISHASAFPYCGLGRRVVGWEGFSRFLSPQSLVGSDWFVPKSIVPTVWHTISIGLFFGASRHPPDFIYVCPAGAPSYSSCLASCALECLLCIVIRKKHILHQLLRRRKEFNAPPPTKVWWPCRLSVLVLCVPYLNLLHIHTRLTYSVFLSLFLSFRVCFPKTLAIKQKLRLHPHIVCTRFPGATPLPIRVS